MIVNTPAAGLLAVRAYTTPFVPVRLSAHDVSPADAVAESEVAPTGIEDGYTFVIARTKIAAAAKAATREAVRMAPETDRAKLQYDSNPEILAQDGNSKDNRARSPQQSDISRLVAGLRVVVF